MNEYSIHTNEVTSRSRGFNASARFLPAQPGSGAEQLPAMEVAGVQVYVYVKDGVLVISAHFDESELGDPTPVSVRMSGETVWESQPTGP